MPSAGATYTGRFAPSPTGPLHAGSMVAALASWLDARAHGGRWLVRIEDTDTERCLPGMDQVILRQLADCALLPDEPPVWQTQRSALYAQAFERLQAAQLTYPCGCSRQDIELALARLGRPHLRHGERVYPGTCRAGLAGKAPRAWRFATWKFEANMLSVRVRYRQSAINSIADGVLRWDDRRLGPQQQDVAQEVGDFVLRRADGPWAYQLAVVVYDADQGITDIVRGDDLADNTARQILLQRALGLPTPRYLHTPLVLGSDGQKLSKQNGASAVDTATAHAALTALDAAARVLGLPPASASARAPADALAPSVRAWAALYNPRP